MVITFCGHSQSIIDKNEIVKITDYLLKVIKCYPNAIFYIGGYGNFDNEMCKILSKLKTKFSNIKIIFVTPYLSPSYSKLKYADKYFDEIIYPPIESAPKKLAIIKRNEWMVDNCDLLIAHISHSWGGANKTLEYAVKKGKPYINFAR